MTTTRPSTKAELSSNKLKRYIRRGRAWLLAHNQKNSEGQVLWGYSEALWRKNKFKFDELVADAKRRGLSREDCFYFEEDTLEVNDMTPEEVLICLLGLR